MGKRSLQSEEYEMQHYEFTSTEFINQYNRMFEEHLGGCINKIQLPDMTDDELEKKKATLLEIYAEKSKDAKQEFEAVLRKTFEIPANVLLEQDVDQNLESTEADIAKLNEEIEELEKSYLRSKMMIALCNKELEVLKQLEGTMSITDDLISQAEEIQAEADEQHDEQAITEALTKSFNLMGGDACRHSSKF